MIDLLLTNTSRGDIGIDAGRIVPPEPARETRDLGGRLVTPPLVEPHIHLDAVLTVGQPRANLSGSLFEGIAIWAERVRDLEQLLEMALGGPLRRRLERAIFVRRHPDLMAADGRGPRW